MEDNPQSNSNRTLSFKEKVFGDAQRTRLEIELFENELVEMREFLQHGEFKTENEGWRYLLAAGYSYLRGQQRLEASAGSEEPNPVGAEENLRRLVEIEAMYAVMKQRAYVWMKDHEVMELQTNALHTMAFGYKAKTEDLHAENQALKAELAQLRRQCGDAAPTAAPSDPSESSLRSAPISWLKRLLKRE